ncbi:MAG: AbrB family transcriptional regulator [Hormoscilla sp. GM7CHS1pb]|nr:AbrB family transcriptional regulator [Hormoscilla sp. GM7CHS1pb]MBC6478683.1 AbrB family transcriptional regulator [Hormoscilla sp. GM7CHS1pb]
MVWLGKSAMKLEANRHLLAILIASHPRRWDSIPQIAKISTQLAVAIVAGLLCNWLHVPVGWLIGPLVVGIAYALIQGNPQPLPAAFMSVGQAVIAIATAAGFDYQTLARATTYALPLLLCIIITGSLSLCNGYLLWRWAGIDWATGFLGSIPGASHSLVAMSEEMGADAIAVALLQYIRVLLVSLIIPTLASLFFPIDAIAPSVTTIPTESHLVIWLNLLVLVACGGLGIWGGRWLRLPAKMFLGPFLAGLVAVWTLPQQLQMPDVFFSAGLLLVGLSVGLKFDWETTRKLFKAVLLEVALVIVLILICLGVGYEFHLVTQVDTMTSVLGCTPGGITAMIATVIQLGGDSGLVLAMQMTRMLLILLISPILATFILQKAAGYGCESQGK